VKPLHTIFSQTFKLSAKTIMTFLAVGLGTGILILAISISDSFQTAVNESLTGDGLIINIANAELSSDGTLAPVRPAQFDQDIITVLSNSISGIQAAAPITTASWRTASVGSSQYQLRRVTGTSHGYLEVIGLELVAGLAFTVADVTAGETKALISRSTAEALYGSVDLAIGQRLQPPARTISRGGGGANAERTTVAQIFTVGGVFEDVDEVKRRSYGIADVLIPYTSNIQGGMNMATQLQSPFSTITVRVTGQSFALTASQIRDVLTQQYGMDTVVHVWEGQPNGASSMLEETRNSISTFSLVINLLGFVLLLTGSIGILSIMIVEVLGKNRDIAMERALGASKGSIIVEFFIRSLLMSLFSAAGGVVIAYLFAQPISRILWPIISTMGTQFSSSSVITVRSLVIGLAATLGIGGVFGSIPVFSAFKAPIAESIREG
jgi:putative ABC transport system permease protein